MKISIIRTVFIALSIGLSLSATAHAQQIEECDGMVIMEVERATVVPGWTFDSSVPGFAGTGYYQWTGANSYNKPGIGVLSYSFIINNAGTYNINLHNYHNVTPSDQGNDVWMRMNGSNWIKVYSNQGSKTIGVWNWHSMFDPGKKQANYALGSGLNTLEISGRSQKMSIDRIHMWKVTGHPDKMNLNAKETFGPCGGGPPPPPPPGGNTGGNTGGNNGGNTGSSSTGGNNAGETGDPTESDPTESTATTGAAVINGSVGGCGLLRAESDSSQARSPMAALFILAVVGLWLWPLRASCVRRGF